MCCFRYSVFLRKSHVKRNPLLDLTQGYVSLCLEVSRHPGAYEFGGSQARTLAQRAQRCMSIARAHRGTYAGVCRRWEYVWDRQVQVRVREFREPGF